MLNCGIIKRSATAKEGQTMLETYHDCDTISITIFWLIMLLGIYLAICKDEKELKKKGKIWQCSWCENRNKKCNPKKCPKMR